MPDPALTDDIIETAAAAIAAVRLSVLDVEYSNPLSGDGTVRLEEDACDALADASLAAVVPLLRAHIADEERQRIINELLARRPDIPPSDDPCRRDRVIQYVYDEVLRELRTELRRTEGDLTVAVAEAQRARGEHDELRDAMVELQSLPSTAELLRLREQRRAVLDLCDQAEYDARTERDLGSGLDGSGVVWIGDIRAALEATREGNV
jgi:hypothetical protein